MASSYGRWAGMAVAAMVAVGGAGPAGAGVEQAQYRNDPYGGGRGGYYEDRDRGYGDQRGYDQRGYDQRGYDQRGYQGREAAAPRGTYLQSCGQVQAQGSTLSAICKGDRGRLFETSIDLSRCGRSDIGNSGGTLECSGTRGRSRRAD